MANSETGEVNSSSSDLETEGLSGIDLRVEGLNLRIGDLPSPFYNEGNGTRQEPLVPMANMHIRDTLENTRYILESIDLKRTLFFKHQDRLLGVDSAGHVQLINDKKLPQEVFKRQTAGIEELLNSMREHEKDPDKWTLSIVDQE